MIIISDSGSTKTHWRVVTSSERKDILTSGINPFLQSEDTILGILRGELLPQMNDTLLTCESLEKIFFYGAGCRDGKIAMMKELLSEVFPSAQVEVNGDLLGAARGVCGRHKGIACILGTGSNSCLYDGENILANVSPMGYILGDEGSGAVLGKLFVNALYKNQLGEDLIRQFEEETKLTVADVIERVYRQPMANRFLASFARFIHSHLDNIALHELVVNNFRSFFRMCVSNYQCSDLPVSAIGSIAFYFREQLAEAASLEGYTLGKIEQSPMDGLCDYHGV